MNAGWKFEFPLLSNPPLQPEPLPFLAGFEYMDPRHDVTEEIQDWQSRKRGLVGYDLQRSERKGGVWNFGKLTAEALRQIYTIQARAAWAWPTISRI